MGGGRRTSGRPRIEECVKKGLDNLLKAFRNDPTATEYLFPAELTTEERAYIHSIAPMMGMKSKSYGKNENRRLTVMKELTAVKEKFGRLGLLKTTAANIAKLLEEFPVSESELVDVSPLKHGKVKALNGHGQHADCIIHYGPVIPPPVKPSAMLEERQKLPTWAHRQEILDLVAKNQVVMITGDTGSGKTTQVPQYLMELYSERNQPVRIICTQPRRIAAISVAERVAAERSDRLGNSVGYQIRLESRMSAKTALMFCTTGILLRTLMYQDNSLEKVTHLLIDEVHERDRFVDFLLGVLRSRLPRFPDLRVILMSAALDVNVFSSYFSNCPVLHVQGKCYPVTQHFLENALQITDHLRHGLQIGVWDKDEAIKSKKEQNSRSSEPITMDQWIDPNEMAIFDSWIQDVFLTGNVDAVAKMGASLKKKYMPINYRHSVTELTPLMVFAARGQIDLVDDMLKLRADAGIAVGNVTAIGLARSMGHQAVVDLLERHQSVEAESLLKIYQDRNDEDNVNVDLILDLLHHIERQSAEGAVLVFLPGYEEIMSVRDRILYHDPRFASSGRIEVFTLHSSMQSGDQRRVFFPPAKGKRKVVLSTNLAETSITIDDIVFVIDTGKVKVKSYDALTGVSALKAEWVPQASAIQRKGRAGRCREGVCFHLFSRARYESFEKYQIPEIFRVPLEELCLQSKNLAPAELSIADFISLVPEAPSPHVIQRAVKMLQWMDALDPWENVTDLGKLLLELPVEPRLGKMLLTATVLHCLDPVLTIVCCLSHRDPFLLPSEPQEKKAATAKKLELSAGTLSDHMAMLRAFTLWQTARANGRERDFCYKHFLSSNTMEVIHQLRSQILDQLRKSGFVRSFQELNTNASSWVAIKACILSGLYPQVARVSRKAGKIMTRHEPAVRLHMTSALLGDKAEGGSQKSALSALPSEWVVYEEISRYGSSLASLRCVTLVTPVVLKIFGGHCRLGEESIVSDEDGRLGRVTETGEGDDDDDDWEDVTSDESSDDELDEGALQELSEGLENVALAERFSRSPLEPCFHTAESKKKTNNKNKATAHFQLDEWIGFRMDKETAGQLFALRQKWQALFARKMRNPLGPELPGDKHVIDTLLCVIADEEKAAGLPPSPVLASVSDMGRKPKNPVRSARERSPQNSPSGFWQSIHLAANDQPFGHQIHTSTGPSSWRQGRERTNPSRGPPPNQYAALKPKHPCPNWRNPTKLEHRTGASTNDVSERPSKAQTGGDCREQEAYGSHPSMASSFHKGSSNRQHHKKDMTKSNPYTGSTDKPDNHQKRNPYYQHRERLPNKNRDKPPNNGYTTDRASHQRGQPGRDPPRNGNSVSHQIPNEGGNPVSHSASIDGVPKKKQTRSRKAAD